MTIINKLTRKKVISVRKKNYMGGHGGNHTSKCA